MYANFDIDASSVTRRLQSLQALGADMTPAMRDVAALGESQTRMRFRTQKAPDGQKWKPSLRAIVTGGRTLTKDAHLGDSISNDYGHDYAMWGANRIYAAIHQFGGTIRGKSGKLKFRLPGGQFVQVDTVTIPARPFLGISSSDENAILTAIQRRITAVSGGNAHAG